MHYIKEKLVAIYHQLLVESGLPGATRNPVLFATFLLRELWSRDISTRAMALAFQFLFCLVPVLTLVVSMLALLPGLASARSRLIHFLVHEFLPSETGLIEQQVDGFISNAQFFSFLGFVALLYGTSMLVITLAKAINAVHHLRPRRINWYQRLGSLALIGCLFFCALGLAVVTSDPFQSVMSVLDKSPLVTPGLRAFVTGMVFTWILLFLMYKLVPTVSVNTGSAAIAALLAAFAFSIMKVAFLAYAGWSQTYDKIYGVFGTLFLSLLWVYLAWFVVLVGATMAFVLQHYDLLAGQARKEQLGQRYPVFFACRLLLILYREARAGRTPVAVEWIAEEMGLHVYEADHIADILGDGGLLLQSGDNHWESLAPAMSAEQLNIADVARTMTSEALEIPSSGLPSGPAEIRVANMLSKARTQSIDQLAGYSMADLLELNAPHNI